MCQIPNALPDLAGLRSAASRYLSLMSQQPRSVRLTQGSDASDYARCFLIFLGHTLKQPLPIDKEQLAEDVRSAVRKHRSTAQIDQKPFRQLLTFSLSALKVLNVLQDDPLAELIEEQIPSNLQVEFAKFGCLGGRPGGGNQAMFLAIFLIHGRDYLGLNVQSLIDEWVDLHLKTMNRFGFWGPGNGMTHLQFQNGYHQHEILEFLGIRPDRLAASMEAVCALADKQGHFAPYPGGGGCYDYDAVFMLTPDGHAIDKATSKLLLKTANTIALEQKADGGFAESIYVRPRSMESLSMFAERMFDARRSRSLLIERLRYAIALQRPKNDRIHTHWSSYSRHWYESNLWDTWFRVLALARIEAALLPDSAWDWGFIDYPGIGYHHSLRQSLR